MPGYGPLAGVRVVDSGRYVAGPWAATYLGDLGAEVIHVEGPPFGPPYADPTRTLPPLLPAGEAPPRAVSESWVQYGRNKLSLGIDLAHPEGREVFLDLLECSDIWVESSRPGTYGKLGLPDAVVQRRNPELSIVHVSGFGQWGDPERIAAPSFDLVGQAYSGFLALQGDPEPAPPMRAGTALNDTVTGLAAATAALAAHVSRTHTGRGQVVDVAQYEVFFQMLENLALDFFARGVVRRRHGNAHARLHPYDVLAAKDGWVVVAAPTAAAWAKLRDLIGLPSGPTDSMQYRTEHREEVDPAIQRFVGARTVAELERVGREHDLAISRVYDIAGIAEDPHYRARGLFLEWTDPVVGPVKGAGIVPKFTDTPGGVWRGAPWLGQDNERILGSLLGYPPDRIRRLAESGVTGADPPPGVSPGGSE